MNDGSYTITDMSIDQQQSLLAKQNTFKQKAAALCSFLFKYCTGTKVSHLVKKYSASIDYISFYEDIVAAYEKTGKNAEAQMLQDKLLSIVPPETDCAVTDFTATFTTFEKVFDAIEQLPKEFKTLYSAQNKLQYLEKALYRDKKQRFSETLKFINDTKTRTWSGRLILQIYSQLILNKSQF